MIKERKELPKEYQAIFKTLLEMSGSTEKQAMAMALMLLADTIATRHIFNNGAVDKFELLFSFFIAPFSMIPISNLLAIGCCHHH